MLTGMTILHPKLNLVIVEGGKHSIAKYRKLMLQRIKWTEIAPATATQVLENSSRGAKAIKDPVAEAAWLKAEDEDGQLRDMSGNRCILLWEGEEKQRSFKKWSYRVCETDAAVRDALGRSKMENMWQSAKNWTAASM
ncbi:hypothetical protein MRB53_038518 [Persea americana]|nr:hypothetical protein MRB53_038518 [Persea americana]